MSGRQGSRNPFELDETVKSIASEIRRLEEDRSKLATALRDVRRSLEFTILSPQIIRDILEERFSYEVKRTDLVGLRVAGIDGGIVARSYQNIDLILTRAVGAIFTYRPGGKLEVGYFPEETPLPSIISNLMPSSVSDFELRASIERITCELQLAIALQDYAKVDLIILDGSIVPQLSDRPPFYSTLGSRYRKVVDLYETLYRLCMDTGTLLAGVVEDSRSIRYMQILGRLLPHLIEKVPSLKKILEFDYRRVVQQTKDADLLEKVLDPGERTSVFHYAESDSDYSAFGDFSSKTWADLVNVFYLRTVEFDKPIRVEYLGTGSNKVLTARKIASAIYPLSCHHAQYGIPSVLIEADARAHLRDGDIEIIYEQLIEKTGNPLMLAKIRRERRPFW
ncbi:MAG: DNA double-strand break repair nuclease NurA [Promethearchaeati archaeon SRVP18_Atabeyarchaeia-1]